MLTIPLHPAVVHFPIALAPLAAVVALALIVSFARRREIPRAWNLLVILLALTLAGGVVASRTGEAEEERVERFVDHQALEHHEELGESFVPTAAVALTAALIVPIVRKRRFLCAGVALLCLLGTLFLGALTLRIGRSGGELVYLEGAARAYQTEHLSQIDRQ